MKLSYLAKGLPGHPLHPPLTEPAHRAVAPVPTPEKEAAAGERPREEERGGLTA